MGAKHSKPRIRRGQRFSSVRKRQAPEGSNDPPTITNESWNHGYCKMDTEFSNTHNTEEKYQFSRVPEKHRAFNYQENSQKITDDIIAKRCGFQSNTEKSSFLSDIMHQTDLKVDLPNSPGRCRNCNTIDKCKSLPPKVSPVIKENNNLTDKEEDEWTITLYEIDKMSGRVPREDMVRLMSSIYDAVDNKVGESPQGRKTVRVRLSVTPERRTQSKLHQTPSNQQRTKTDCRCQDCPKTEPPNRRISNGSRVRRHRSDVSPTRLKMDQTNQHISRQRSFREHHSQPQTISGENLERKKHYSKLEGLDQRFIHENKSLADNSKSRSIKSPHGIRHRTLPKVEPEKSNSKAKERRLRCHGNESRNVMHKNRKRDLRFASPYDHHFQEAMYLRLKELQRQGAHEICRATGRLRDSDEADDDSSSDSENENNLKSNFESNNKNAVFNSVEPDINCKIEATLTGKFAETACDYSRLNGTSSSVSNVYHHHHYHHGISGQSVLAAICSSDSSPVLKNVADSSSIAPPNGNSEQHFHHYHHHYHHPEKS